MTSKTQTVPAFLELNNLSKNFCLLLCSAVPTIGKTGLQVFDFSMVELMSPIEFGDLGSYISMIENNLVKSETDLIVSKSCVERPNPKPLKGKLIQMLAVIYPKHHLVLKVA